MEILGSLQPSNLKIQKGHLCCPLLATQKQCLLGIHLTLTGRCSRLYIRLGCLSPGHGRGKVFRLWARVYALGFGKDSLGGYFH